MNYYRKPINKTVDDVKLKMQMGVLTVKINDLLEVDKNIEKDINNNSNSIKNMKNEIDLELSDKIDNYYDKNEIDLKFNDLYNKTYIDHKLNNIYDKNQTNDKISKLDRNIVLFNTNLTNFIDKTYKNDKEYINENIKDNKDTINNFINTFTTFSNNINTKLTDLEDDKITDSQSNKLTQLEDIDLGKNSSYNFALFNKNKLDKMRYYISEFIPFNITLVKKFTFIGAVNEIMILQFELDQRKFDDGDTFQFFLKYNDSI